MNSADKKFNQRLELLEESVRLHHSFLVQYANRITLNWADAQDVVSELWKYATAHLKDEHINCLPVLRRKVYFLSIDCIRKRKRQETLTDDFEHLPVAAPSQDAFSSLEEDELAQKFWRELGPVSLTEKQKQVTWLSIRFSYTYAEIAARMQISPSTIGDWVAKGKLVIRKAMR